MAPETGEVLRRLDTDYIPELIPSHSNGDSHSYDATTFQW